MSTEYVTIHAEATDEMMWAGVRAAQAKPPNSEGKVGHMQVRAVWDAMIAAAQRQEQEGDSHHG